MPIVVRDHGFKREELNESNFVDLEDARKSDKESLAVELPNCEDPQSVKPLFPKIEIIRIKFPNFGDGRGFSLAGKLRELGYAGRLRAAGYVISDQYAIARRSGFDEVEIDEALAARQPETQWISKSKWKAHFYQDRLVKVNPDSVG
ncbi:MAG: DUF934 domain-containing protein [Albidovulum sp.]|nr:DUF934 domain-containing protein [Albidovulum sp.]MDE0305506.1 DUF934 domain-containing protein [Albidovulum sp.]MDE0533409.1 DUF934 domain-containing protein [Albidovulum sp.]